MATTCETGKLDRIKREYERDVTERPLARTLDDVPAFYDCITPEWLTQVVRQRHPDVTVTGFTLGERDSGTTNRRRIFLEYSVDDQERGYPRSLFCKAAQELANRITMSVGSAVGEVRFYNQIRPCLSIDAPLSYFAKVDENSFKAIIVLEDMVQDVEFCSSATPVSRSRAESQMAVLAKLHGRFYQSPELTGEWSALDHFPDRFQRMADYHGLAEACDRGLIAAQSVMPASLFARRAEVWPLTMRSIEQLRTLPQMLTHGDVHLGNWYVRPDETMGLSDFQNVTRGHWSRDVAYTIATSLSIADRRAWERGLIALYIDLLGQNCGHKEDFAESWTNYRQQMLSVLAYWTVTLTPSPSMAQDMQSTETTLCFLERIGQAMEDLQTLDSFG
jgi:hypothetical protein